MEVVFSSENLIKGKLVSAKIISDYNDIDGQIVYLNDERFFSIGEWFKNLPSCVLVNEVSMFSHIVSYCMSMHISVICVSEDEVMGLLDREIIIDCEKNIIGLYTKDKNEEYGVVCDNAFVSDVVQTKDGQNINLFATIKSVENAHFSKKRNIRNAGLVCTEFLYGQGSSLSIEKELTDICSCFVEGEIAIRLFDYDVDKFFVQNVEEDTCNNLRGIRAYSNTCIKKIFEKQIKTIVKLSKHYNVTVVIPYVTNVDDVRIIDELIKKENDGKSLPICVMIETVASFFDINKISNYSQSFSIGTNDLLSSFFSCDRNVLFHNQHSYINPYSTSLINFLSMYDDSKKCKTKICGQLAFYPLMLEVLISLGFRNFSIPVTMFDSVSKRISNIVTVPQKELLQIINERLDCLSDNAYSKLKSLFGSTSAGF